MGQIYKNRETVCVCVHACLSYSLAHKVTPSKLISNDSVQRTCNNQSIKDQVSDTRAGEESEYCKRRQSSQWNCADRPHSLGHHW